MHVLVRSIALHEDLPNDFDEAGVSKTVSFMNPVMMYLEDFMTEDIYYSISAVVLRDGRFVFGKCPPDEVRAIASLPQSERWDAVLGYAKRVAVEVLNNNLAFHSVSVNVDDNVSRLLRDVLARCSDTAPSYHIRALGIILDAIEDCEQYPFSRTIDAFLDWPLVDVTEYQEEDLDYGQEAIFVVDLHT